MAPSAEVIRRSRRRARRVLRTRGVFGHTVLPVLGTYVIVVWLFHFAGNYIFGDEPLRANGYSEFKAWSFEAFLGPFRACDVLTWMNVAWGVLLVLLAIPLVRAWRRGVATARPLVVLAMAGAVVVALQLSVARSETAAAVFDNDVLQSETDLLARFEAKEARFDELATRLRKGAQRLGRRGDLLSLYVADARWYRNALADCGVSRGQELADAGATIRLVAVRHGVGRSSVTQGYLWTSRVPQSLVSELPASLPATGAFEFYHKIREHWYLFARRVGVSQP